jgi:hypothetical protein
VLEQGVKEILSLYTFPEKLKRWVDDLLASLTLNTVKTEDSQLFVTFFVGAFEEPIHVSAVRNPVKSLGEEVFTTVVNLINFGDSAT